jgi:hypothetical protein
LRDHRDFADFYEASLQFFYEAATAIRLSAGIQKFRYITMGFIAVIVIGLWSKVPKLLLIPVAAGGYYWLATSSILKSKRYSSTLAQVQQQALNDLVALHQPHWRYTIRSPRMRKEIRDSGLFPQRLDFVHEQGCIAGMVGMCLMAAVKIDIGNYFFITQKVGKVARRLRSRRSAFEGFLIAMEYPKSFQGSLIINREVPEGAATLEMLPFERIFNIQTQKTELVDLLVTPLLREQLMFLDQQYANFPFTLSFKDSVLYVALPWEQDLFSPATAEQSNWHSAYGDSRAIEMLGDITKGLLLEQQILDPTKRSL